MNDEPISLKEKKKLHAMIRDIARQVPWQGEMMDESEWKLIIFAGAYGQDVITNPMLGFPGAPDFIIRNKRRTRDMTVSSGADLITQLYAFGNERSVEWSDPEWLAMRAQEQQEAERLAA